MSLEPTLSVDLSGSTRGPADEFGMMSCQALETAIAQTLVNRLAGTDTMASDEVTPSGKNMGGLFTVGFSDAAAPVGRGHMAEIYPDVDREEAEEHAGDLNQENFSQLWKTIRWGGGTNGMKAVEFQLAHYKKEFGHLPEEEQPDLALWILTDGALNDGDRFAMWLRGTQGHVHVGTIIVGRGQGHDDALRQWTKIAAENPLVRVFPANGSTDVNALASQLLGMLE